jgi:hypothetical protein
VKIKEIKKKVKGDRRKMKLVRSYEKDFKKVKDLEGKDREFMLNSMRNTKKILEIELNKKMDQEDKVIEILKIKVSGMQELSDKIGNPEQMDGFLKMAKMSLDEIKNFPDDLREVMLESLDKKITQFAEQILGGA